MFCLNHHFNDHMIRSNIPCLDRIGLFYYNVFSVFCSLWVLGITHTTRPTAWRLTPSAAVLRRTMMRTRSRWTGTNCSNPRPCSGRVNLPVLTRGQHSTLPRISCMLSNMAACLLSFLKKRNHLGEEKS